MLLLECLPNTPLSAKSCCGSSAGLSRVSSNFLLVMELTHLANWLRSCPLLLQGAEAPIAAKEDVMTTGMMRGDFSFLVLAGGIALLLGYLVPNADAEQPVTQSQQGAQGSASSAGPASAPALQPGQLGSLPSARKVFFSPERGAFFSFPVEPGVALLLKQPEFHLESPAPAVFPAGSGDGFRWRRRCG